MEKTDNLIKIFFTKNKLAPLQKNVQQISAYVEDAYTLEKFAKPHQSMIIIHFVTLYFMTYFCQGATI